MENQALDGKRGFVMFVFLTCAALSGGVWIEKILYSFGGAPGDGEEPKSGVIPDSHGNLFGVTGGGADYAGIVYKMSQ